LQGELLPKLGFIAEEHYRSEEQFPPQLSISSPASPSQKGLAKTDEQKNKYIFA
jgi:hypothetical protein